MGLSIINGNLNKNSSTSLICNYLVQEAKKSTETVHSINAWEYPLPCCDAGPSFQDPSIEKVKPLLHESNAILIASPIYNYTLTSYIKTLIEHTGDSWKDKVVGFAVNAGGAKSYMAVYSTIQTMMLDFRCWVIPRHVYLDPTAFEDKALTDDIKKRLNELVQTATRFNTHYNLICGK